MDTTDRTPLPEFSDDRLRAVEDAVMARVDTHDAIAPPRSLPVASRRRRRRALGLALGAAATVVAASFVGPALVTPIAADAPAAQTEEVSVDYQSDDEMLVEAVAPGPQAQADAAEAASAAEPGSDVITTASLSIEVSDLSAAIADAEQHAQDLGGNVSSMGRSTLDLAATAVPEGGAPVAANTTAWLTVRVPADRLDEAIDRLGELGTVTESSTMADDVSMFTTDLRAREASLAATIERLTAIMDRADNVTDLIAAEAALSQRQAEIEGIRSQLAIMEDQIAMSTVQVNLTERASATVEPGGFGSGFGAGWDAFLASVNGTIIGLGFILPWIAILGLLGGAVWLVVRAIQRRRTAGAALRTEHPAVPEK